MKVCLYLIWRFFIKRSWKFVNIQFEVCLHSIWRLKKILKVCLPSIWRIFIKKSWKFIYIDIDEFLLKIAKVCLHSYRRIFVKKSWVCFTSIWRFFLSKIVINSWKIVDLIWRIFLKNLYFCLSRMICSIIANIQKTWIANWNPWHVQILDVSIQRLNK